MNPADYRLPSGFEVLEPFVDSWAIAGSANRVGRRLNSDESERIAFYAAAQDRLSDALALLDRKPLDQLDEKERRLMDLMLSLAHVSIAIEVQGDEEADQAVGRAHMKIKGSTADQDPA